MIKINPDGYRNNLIGNSGQYLAMHLLTMHGIESHTTEPGSSCDIISLYQNKYIKFQVKTIYKINADPFYRFCFVSKKKNRAAGLKANLDKSDGYIMVVLEQKIVSYIKSNQILTTEKRYRSKEIDYTPYIDKGGITRYNQPYLEDLTLEKFLNEWED